MIRTRDFLLFLLVVSFLVLAISYTAVWSGETETVQSMVLQPAPATSTYDVTITEPGRIDRHARILALRQQIAALNGSTISSDTTISPELTDETAVATDAEVHATTTDDVDAVIATTSTAVQLCTNYAPSTLWWPDSGIQTAELDGMRVVYVEPSATDIRNTASTSDSISPASDSILVQLPMRTLPIGGESCLQSDVVGVALDGSLIRNQDYTAYRVMEKYTLIGYALDGFPIYGSAPDVETDACGGTVVGVSYRYYLSPEREGIVGCFAGVPVRL